LLLLNPITPMFEVIICGSLLKPTTSPAFNQSS
jgi:hypothetical protein